MNVTDIVKTLMKGDRLTARAVVCNYPDDYVEAVLEGLFDEASTKGPSKGQIVDRSTFEKCSTSTTRSSDGMLLRECLRKKD